MLPPLLLRSCVDREPLKSRAHKTHTHTHWRNEESVLCGLRAQCVNNLRPHKTRRARACAFCRRQGTRRRCLKLLGKRANHPKSRCAVLSPALLQSRDERRWHGTWLMYAYTIWHEHPVRRPELVSVRLRFIKPSNENMMWLVETQSMLLFRKKSRRVQWGAWFMNMILSNRKQIIRRKIIGHNENR